MLMEERSVIHSTFVIERSYAVSPERVFAAFADPAKKRRWFAEGHGHDVEHFEMDFRVGGKELARFRFTKDSPVKNLTCISDAIIQDIVPNRRVVLTSTMTIGDRRISAALATVEFMSSDKGTDLILTHQAA